MKVLVIRFSSIGDIVLTTPVVRALHQQAGAEVHVAVKEGFAPLWAANPFVHRVHALGDDWSSFVRALRAEDFDEVIDLHNNLRTHRLTVALRRRMHRMPKLNLRKWLYTVFKMDRLPDRHIVERAFEAVHHLGVTPDGQGLDCFIPPDEEVDLDEFPAKYRAGYVAIVIGARWATKRIPAHIVAQLVDGLNEPVVLLGGPDDVKLGMEINSMVEVKAWNACGRFSIHGSASLVRQASAVITPDTGLMHVAAAFQRPTVVVWGSTTPRFGMEPWAAPHVNAEVNGLACRPCSKIGRSSCPKGHFRCMRDQRVDQILSLKGLVASS